MCSKAPLGVVKWVVPGIKEGGVGVTPSPSMPQQEVMKRRGFSLLREGMSGIKERKVERIDRE